MGSLLRLWCHAYLGLGLPFSFRLVWVNVLFCCLVLTFRKGGIFGRLLMGQLRG